MDMSHTASSHTIFRIEGLEKRYKDYCLSIPDLEIPSGVVALLGTSGAGKTTLLNILASLDTGYQGRVYFEDGLLGRDTSQADALRQRSFSFAFQTSNLLANLPVSINAELSRMLAGVHSPEAGWKDILPKFFEDLSDSDLAAMVRRYPSELSAGQKQRIAAARALVKALDGAAVLFADEPTANVDRRSADKCFDMLRSWQRSGEHRLVLLATHDLILAQRADYVVLLDTQPTEHKSGPTQVGVGTHGPTASVWPQVEKVLLNSSPMPESTGPADPPALLKRPSTLRVLKFLLAYCWKDTTRRRELADLFIRVGVMWFLFLIVAASTTLFYGVPTVIDGIFKNDRLLRLVDLQSTGSFPIRPEKMAMLASLARVDGRIEVSESPEEQPVKLVAGVSPKVQMPLLFYDAAGQISQRWVDDVRVVYQGHPDLPNGEQLFRFWRIAPIASWDQEVPKVLVSSSVLARLGFEPEEFKQRLAENDPNTCLYVNDRGYKLFLHVERVEDLPSQQAELLVPAKLADMVREHDPRIQVKRYTTAAFGLYPSAEEAQRKLPEIVKALESLRNQKGQPCLLKCATQLSHESSDGAYEVCVQTEMPDGLYEDEWTQVKTRIDRISGKAHRVEYTGRVVGDGHFVDTARPLGKGADMATLFVTNHTDTLDLLKYLAANRNTLKIHVIDPDNKKEVGLTALLMASMGVKGVSWVLFMFVCTCLVAVAYSFLAMLQRKLGEIGILRAYGASRRFVLSRFVMEIFSVCILGCIVTSLLFFEFVLPWLNDRARQMFPEEFKEGTSLPAYSPLYIGISSGILVMTLLVVGVMVWRYVRRPPAQLLSMRE